MNADSSGRDERWRGASRRRFLSLVGGGALGTCTLGAAARPATAQADGALPAGARVALEPVAEGFTAPVGVEFLPGEGTALVVDQAGRVVALDDGGQTPFLDVTDRMVDVGGYDERGLLGLAVHPDYPETRTVYVRYSAPPRAGTPDGWDHTFVLSEFTVHPNGQGVRSDSERTLLEIPEPQMNHNGGGLAFGPEGYLYVGVGDGGASGDRGTGHVEDWYAANPGGNGQDVTENLLGSVLRIDVDRREDGRGYAVPADNPLVGRAGRDEHWAWGFRNPWRLSVDDGDLFVADVGQNRYEEVDLVERGGNYGWNVREGAHCYGAGAGSGDCPTETPDGQPLRPPVVEYPHDYGRAVIGGYRYHGDAVPALRGAYVFGDWVGTGGGALFAARPDGDGPWSLSKLEVAGTASGDPGRYVLGFGRDGDGELYVTTSARSGVGGSTGAVHRLVSPGTTETTTGTDTVVEGTSEAPVPGFGVGAALAGVAGAGAYLLGREE